PLPMNLFARETEVLGIRAEHIMVVQGDADLQGTVIDSALIGASRVLSVQTNAGRARVVALGTPSALGTTVGLRFAPEHVRRFDAVSGQAK
ncbi:MAG: TOBE domain-containing protein, partial [Candidatus Eremiobacteraeota bacterium]|nr:TOBE domain-containing protein [Candidatus Eremiobacteraeota bacterium]